MTTRLVTGQRPTLTQPEWGLAMGYIQNFIDTLTCSLPAHFVLCAYTEYAEDEINSAGNLKILSRPSVASSLRFSQPHSAT